MPTIKKILVPTDLSPCSYNALEYAIQLAAKSDAKIYLLNICDAVSSFRELRQTKAIAKEMAIKESKRLLKDKLSSLKQELTKKNIDFPKVSTIVEEGDTDTRILQVADEKKADLIILGTKGDTDSFNKYLGSTAMEVYRNASCPVLIIPEEGKFNKKITMAYASKFLTADPFKIWRAQRVFRPLKTAVRFVHFYDDDVSYKSQLQELMDYFEETSPKLDISFSDLPETNWIDDMNKFIKKEGVNVLVIYKPKRGFFDSLFKKSFTKEMALHMKIPLLVFKDE